MSAPAWAQAILATAAVLIALGTIYRYVLPALRGLWRAGKRIVKAYRGSVELVEDFRVTGGFAGLKQQNDALTEQVAAVTEQVAQVKDLAEKSHKELHPNGGGSLRDAVDEVRKEARTAVGHAEQAAGEARIAAEGVVRLEGYAQQSREGLADLRDQANDLSQRVTDMGEHNIAQDQRISDHRRRNDETITSIRSFLEGEHRDALLAREALQASVTELLNMPDQAPPREPLIGDD